MDVATDRTKDEAESRSRGCPYCAGSGQATLFAADFDGRRVVEREAVVRGEVKWVRTATIAVAHCACPMGRWMRSKSGRDILPRIPDLNDVLAGRTRWLAHDPTGDMPGHAFRANPAEMRRKLAAHFDAKPSVISDDTSF